MSAPGNFKFSLYLKESWLTEQERFNLERIFSALLPERQVEILDHWPKYLDKLLEIKHYADEERRRNIANAFERIERLVSEAELRAEEARSRAEETEATFQSNLAWAEEYDRKRKLEVMRNAGRPPVCEKPEGEIPRKLEDPLSAFL